MRKFYAITHLDGRLSIRLKGDNMETALDDFIANNNDPKWREERRNDIAEDFKFPDEILGVDQFENRIRAKGLRRVDSLYIAAVSLYGAGKLAPHECRGWSLWVYRKPRA